MSWGATTSIFTTLGIMTVSITVKKCVAEYHNLTLKLSVVMSSDVAPFNTNSNKKIQPTKTQQLTADLEEMGETRVEIPVVDPD